MLVINIRETNREVTDERFREKLRREEKRTLISYLIKIIERCEKYDAFLIPGAIGVDGQLIQLHDVYTHLNVLSRVEYEDPKRMENDHSGNEADYDQDDYLEWYIEPPAKNASILAGLLRFVDDEESKLATDFDEVVVDTLDQLGSEPEDLIPAQIILSAPGGGKTTLLKMFAMAYAFKTLNALSSNSKAEGFSESDLLRFEEICSQLDVENEWVPFFIEARNIKKISDYMSFSEIIESSVSIIIDDEKTAPYYVDCIEKSSLKKVIIIDSIEELSELERTAFLAKLERYEESNKGDIANIIISSRYKEYQHNEYGIRRIIGCNKIKEYVISELYNDFDRITEFSERWFNSIKKVHGLKIDIENDFINPVKNNPNALNLITNPLELTSMLLISSSDNFLPQDISKMYGRSIELWITWNNTNRYNYEDVMSQLAHIAYKMAISENDRITIDEEGLNRIIREARRDLQRYFKQQWDPDEDLSEFRKFLNKSHIFDCNGGNYEFVHRQYQAYLVAYCIKNNLFSRESRKKSRYEYLDEHIRDRDDFWNQIIVLVSMLDFSLRDSIIERLMEYADYEKVKVHSDYLEENPDENDWSNYYTGMLLQLAVVPGINLDDFEVEHLYRLIINNEVNWETLEWKKTDINKFLAINSAKNNDLFLDMLGEKIDSIDEESKRRFLIKQCRRVAFFCLWNCEVSDEVVIDRICKQLFIDYLDVGIVKEIYSARRKGDIRKRKLFKVLSRLAAEKFNRCGTSDKNFYYLIAVMKGYAEPDKTPYDIAINMLQSNNAEEYYEAVYLLELAAWFIRTDNDKQLGFDYELLGEKENILIDFIGNGIKEKQHVAFIKTLSDLYCAKKTNKIFSALHTQEIFTICSQKLMEQLSKNDAESVEKCFDILEFLSTFPDQEYKDIFCRCFIDSKASKKLFETNSGTINATNITDVRRKIMSLKALSYLYSSESNHDYENKIVSTINGSLAVINECDWSIWAYLVLNSLQLDEKGKKEKRVLLNRFDIYGINVEMGGDAISEGMTHYLQGEYEKAKKDFLREFQKLEAKNNLAYMLRRKEISSVIFDGREYNVQELLHEGVTHYKSYALVNYALYISQDEEKYHYYKGLAFLQNTFIDDSLIEVFDWWYDLLKKGEPEGLVVLMWLCEFGYDLFYSKQELEDMRLKKYSDQMVYEED